MPPANRMSVAERQMYEKMINRRFDPMIEQAAAVTEPLRSKVRDQIKKQLGISELENEVDSLERQLHAKKNRLERIVGYNGHKLDKLVRAAMNGSGTIHDQLMNAKQDALEAMWLTQLPEEISELLNKTVVQKLTEFQGKLKQIEASGEMQIAQVEPPDTSGPFDF